MRLRKSTFTLSLLLDAVQSFGAPPSRVNVLNRRQAETQRSASTPSADGERPQLQGGENLF
ncbi:MAG: hypothetical protein QOJ99_782 [Bryobacterales bacterium]|jgi:hypothetical protein|nr:hypothetical protein [Bryobacterales bacterium]